MCFSAGASFSAAAFLTTIGFLSMRHAPARLQFFAMIPLFFAMQQFAEGVIWLITTGIPTDAKSPLVIPLIMISGPIGFLMKKFGLPKYYALLQMAATYVFLAFALIVWPTWIPFALGTAEKNNTRKQMITILLILGIIISGILLGKMLLQGVQATICKERMCYSSPSLFKNIQLDALLLYCLAAIGPLFLSSLRGTTMLGLGILCSAGLTWYAWYAAFGSVWCFFAALLSVSVLSIVHRAKAAS